MRAEDRATFEGMLARIAREGEAEWDMKITPTDNEEDAKVVRFVNRQHEHPMRIPTDPVTGEVL